MSTKGRKPFSLSVLPEPRWAVLFYISSQCMSAVVSGVMRRGLCFDGLKCRANQDYQQLTGHVGIAMSK